MSSIACDISWPTISVHRLATLKGIDGLPKTATTKIQKFEISARMKPEGEESIARHVWRCRVARDLVSQMRWVFQPGRHL
jgi:hypothetical protein